MMWRSLFSTCTKKTQTGLTSEARERLTNEFVKKNPEAVVTSDTIHSDRSTEQGDSNKDKNPQNQQLAEVHTPVSTESEAKKAAPNAFNVSGYKEAGLLAKSEG